MAKNTSHQVEETTAMLQTFDRGEPKQTGVGVADLRSACVRVAQMF